MAETVGGTIAHVLSAAHNVPPRRGNEIRRLNKRLEREVYVASEANATPLASYALLSNFSAALRV